MVRDGIIIYLKSLDQHGDALPVGPDLIIKSIVIVESGGETSQMGFKSLGDPAGSKHIGREKWETFRWPVEGRSWSELF